MATAADILGHLLFKVYRDEPVDDVESHKTASKTAMAAIGDFCEVEYRVVVIAPRRTGIPSDLIPVEDPYGLLAYVIGKATGFQRVMLGRHYRVEVTPDGTAARSVVPTTKDCTAVPKSALGGARYVDHTRARGPTEIHVFLSLLYATKFRVRTAIGIWEIDKGKVHLVTIDPDYRPEKIVVKDCRLPDGMTFATTETACRKAGGTILN